MTDRPPLPDRTLAPLLKQTAWCIELFWTRKGFAARLFSPWGPPAARANPIGASGQTPEEALANLTATVYERYADDYPEILPQ